MKKLRSNKAEGTGKPALALLFLRFGGVEKNVDRGVGLCNQRSAVACPKEQLDNFNFLAAGLCSGLQGGELVTQNGTYLAGATLHRPDCLRVLTRGKAS